jgi:hypothetical protein
VKTPLARVEKKTMNEKVNEAIETLQEVEQDPMYEAYSLDVGDMAIISESDYTGLTLRYVGHVSKTEARFVDGDGEVYKMFEHHTGTQYLDAITDGCQDADFQVNKFVPVYADESTEEESEDDF